MAKFYVKKGAGSLNLDGEVYNEGDLVETTKKIADTLPNVLTTTKPAVEEVIKEKIIKEPIKTPKTTPNDGDADKDEIIDKIEVTIPDLEKEGGELTIDVVSCKRGDLEKVANAMKVTFPGNIGDPKLREKIIKQAEKEAKQD